MSRLICLTLDDDILLVDNIDGNNFHLYAILNNKEDVLEVFPDGATAEKDNDSNFQIPTREQSELIWSALETKGYSWDNTSHRLQKATLTTIQVS